MIARFKYHVLALLMSGAALMSHTAHGILHSILHFFGLPCP